MSYKNIVFAKLEKRLFNDPRWYMMSESAQLNYIRFILFAAETYNKIPKNLTALRKGFKTDQDEKTIEKTIKEIKASFKKFKENKHYYYFEQFEEKTNYIPHKEKLGKSQGNTKEGTEEEEEEEEDKEKDKEEDKKNNSAYNSFEKTLFEKWNSLTDNIPLLSTLRAISPERRKKLKKRFENKDYRENIFIAIDEIPNYPFLLGDNDRGWKVSFDWLITNDTNYLKVLEKKYGKDEKKLRRVF
jgi:hypothetical protein